MGNLSHTTGNVGIGNALASTIPGVLTVTDTTNTTKAAFGINAANSLNFIQGGGDYMAIGYNLRHTGTNNTWNYAGNGNEFASLLRWEQGGFQFWGTSTQGVAPTAASLTNFLSIKNSGNVGIGTDAPTVKLDVNGGVKAASLALTGKATSASTVFGDSGTTLVTKDYVDSGIGTVSIITMNGVDLASASTQTTAFTSSSGTDSISSGNNDTNFVGYKAGVSNSGGMPFPSAASGIVPSLQYVNSKGSTTWSVSTGSGAARTIIPSEGTWTVMAYVGKTQGSATPVHAIFIAIRTA